MKTETIHKIGKRILNSNRGKRLYYSISKILYYIIPDEQFLRIMYRLRIGESLNLRLPRRFTEKIQWMKLYYRTPLLTVMADKYAVRDVVETKCGKEVLIPLLGVYRSFDEIDFNALPSSFILKANHGSGWNMICLDKRTFDLEEAKRNFDLWMSLNYYYTGRSWEYKDIEPKIVCEQFISTKNNIGLDDFKIHCFNGQPVYIQLITDRYNGEPYESFYDKNWNIQPFTLTYKRHIETIEKPGNLSKMISIATKLSAGLPYARIDLYNNGGEIYFGEVTLHPANGMDNFSPPEQDLVLGNLIKMDMTKKRTTLL